MPTDVSEHATTLYSCAKQVSGCFAVVCKRKYRRVRVVGDEALAEEMTQTCANALAVPPPFHLHFHLRSSRLGDHSLKATGVVRGMLHWTLRISGRRLMSLAEFIQPHVRTTRPSSALLHALPCAVLSSNSHCIFENLAAEEAIMRSVLLRQGEHLLLMYKDSPCVVVGRNQNIFQEVAVRSAHHDGVAIARRASGGGTVYHDSGNLCFAFVTHRADYAPERTIQVLRLALCRLYGITPARLTTTKRHDLFLDGMKITGSAMRVQRDIAYHHCTLLIDSCRESLGKYLHPEGEYTRLTTTSIQSVRSPVTTLSSACNSPISVSEVQWYCSTFYLRYGSRILSHTAPWELHPVQDAMWVGTSDPLPTHGDTHCVTLDVARAAREDYTFPEGDRRTPSGSPATFTEEVRRLASVDWLFAMPQYVTEVVVTPAELQAAVEAHPMWADVVLLSSLTTVELLDELRTSLFGDGSVLVFRTTVQQRRITSIVVQCAPSDAPLSEAEGGADRTGVWLSSVLEAAMTGEYCEKPVEGLDTAGGEDPILEGLRRESAAAGAVDVPDVCRDACLLLLTQSVVRIWRRKNVLDFAMPSRQCSRCTLTNP